MIRQLRTPRGWETRKLVLAALRSFGENQMAHKLDHWLRSLLSWLTALLLASQLLAARPLPITSSESTERASFNNAVEQSMFRLLNDDRVNRGFTALKWNSQLQQAARKHAQLLWQKKQLSHQFPGESGLVQRISETGLRFGAAAENLAYSTEPDDLHSGLMRSPGHRANILSPKYNAVGIGVVANDGKFFATEDFASVTEESSSAEAEERFGRAFNQLRRSHKMPVVAVESDTSIRSAMCQMADRDKLTAAAVPCGSVAMAVVAFTAGEPDELPSRFVELSELPALKRIFVGSCFRASPTYAGGSYWIGVAY